MLTSLFVRQFAVVDLAEVRLGPGLTVISGETGAGKSLLVDALMLLSGARADSHVVRAGSERADLVAEFDLSALPEARAWLARNDLDDDESCQLRRVVRAEGSSRAWINGRPCTVGQLGELASLLIEIHGQHAHQALLSRHHQLNLLDAYAGHDSLLAELAQVVREWRAVRDRLRHLGGGESRAQRLELLRHECDELAKWALPTAALAELEASHRRLANADRLVEGVSNVAEWLDGDSELSARRALARARAELDKLAMLDRGLQGTLDLLETAQVQLGEASDQLNRYAQNIEQDPARLSDIDTQLARLHELSRRHRLPVAELHGKWAQLRNELDELDGADEILQQLTAQLEQLQQRYSDSAAELSRRRRQAADQLAREVSRLMDELGMRGGQLTVAWQPQSDEVPDPQGRERCELLVSANPGQPLRALRKVASGGELARISLAIEVAMLGKDSTGSMVFDEVDSGIGGAIAEVVGQKLRTLGTQRQVLCVTHLAQVAAQGHAHLSVSKQIANGVTHTAIQSLDLHERGNELARMLGGVEITSATLAHAQQMLQRAQAI